MTALPISSLTDDAIDGANDNSPGVDPSGAFVRRLDDLPMEGGVNPVFGDVAWRTLISADRTPSSDFVLGVAEFGPFGVLHLHRHAPPEFYLCLAGSGVATIDGCAHVLAAGAAVFIPGGVEHGVRAGAAGLKFAYGFAQHAFSDVEYMFSEAKG